MFETMPADDRASLSRMATPRHFLSGEIIFRRGDAPDGLYILQSGGVVLTFTTTDGRDITHSYATVGAVFGEIAALDGGARSADAEALTDGACLWLSSDRLNAAIETWPSFGRVIIRFLCARVREADDKLEAIVLQSTQAKLARFLLSAVEARTKGRGAMNVPVTLAISHSELGILIGATSANVSAALAQLAGAHAVTVDAGKIICEPTILRRMAGNGPD